MKVCTSWAHSWQVSQIVVMNGSRTCSWPCGCHVCGTCNVYCLCLLLQGGIHPDFTGATYLSILAAAKAGAPDIHVHAFSPLEVMQVSGALLRCMHVVLQICFAADIAHFPQTGTMACLKFCQQLVQQSSDGNSLNKQWPSGSFPS